MTWFTRPALLIGAGVVIAKLLVTGQLHYYLSPSFDGLTALTALALAVIGVLELWMGPRRPVRADPETIISLAVVALPLVAGLLVSPRALSASDLGAASPSRLVLTFDPGPPPKQAVPPAPRQPIADFGDVTSYLRQVGESGVGQHVRALGLVAHSDDLPRNEFVLLRYAIVHCVADAQPLGLLIVAPDGTDLSGNQWVAVDGVLASEPRGGDRLVAVEATQIALADEPREPYITPF